ncbi:MAG: Asp-tRNA(Asn)/Glu-tRNA(Gln) amidotransferase subunit GatC [Candidatus Pacebacteria bacterium]|nr:Asp-tRNA(Asn)/Glu-tRNA(Gln) amidotransferase subunit GatC [Candidatus Paceibacterota bacterium]
MNQEDVQKLAHMARIDITKEEGDTLVSSLKSILSYVDQIRALPTDTVPTDMPLFYNIVREDDAPAKATHSHEMLLDNMPERQDSYLQVRKIL